MITLYVKVAAFDASQIILTARLYDIYQQFSMIPIYKQLIFIPMEVMQPQSFCCCSCCCLFVFFSIWFFFHEHSRINGLQGKGEGISSTPHYHFHSLHRYLDISRTITVESSPLFTQLAVGREPGTFRFRAQFTNH